MKTKIKRHSRSVLSVILAICILISCMVAGLIATDAAKTAGQRVGAMADGEALGDGDTTYYMHIGAGAAFRTTSGNAFTYDSTNSYYYYDYAITANTEYVFVINTTSGTLGDGNKSSSTQTVTKLASSWNATGASFDYNYYRSNNYDGYDAFKFKCRSDITIRFTFTSTFADGVTYRLSSGGGEGGGGGTSETWTVAGSSATIFGTVWSPSTTSNDMTLTGDNTYTKSYTVNSTDGFEFKIVKDHKWGEEYPSSNFAVTLATDTSKRSITASGKLYWKSGDTITFTFNSSTHAISITSVTPETTHDVTFSAGTGGTISPSGTVSVGESTATTVTATANAGYKFSSWTNGTGITQKTNTQSGDNQTQTITTKSSGTYTVQANFDKKDLTVSKGTHTGGDFTLSKTSAQIGDTIIISGITANKGYRLATTNPVKYTYNGSTYNATKSGDNYTFTMPGYNTSVSVSFTGLTGNITKTASPSAGLDTFYIANSVAATNDYSTYTVGSARYARVKAKDAYTFDKFVITYGDGSTVTVNALSATYNSTTKFYTTQLNTDGSKFSDSNNGNISVVAYFTKKPTHKVTVVSNNNALGTATASVTEAYEGQQVTLIPREDTGSFSSWSVTSGDVSVSNNKFAMGSSDVAITANFNEYSSENTSEWYYNGYDNNANEMTSTNTPVSGTSMYAQRMIEAKTNGVKYSYYHVSGRNTGNFNTHLFSITKNSPADGGRYIFFETPNKSWTDGHGWKSDPEAQFYYSDKKIAKGWSKLEFDKWTGNENDSNKIWKSEIPYGARYVQFRGTANDGSNWPYTGYINLAEWFSGNNNCVYLNSSTKTNNEYRDYAYKQVGDTYPTGNFFEYMSGDSGIAYSNICSTGGFDNHNVNSVKGINNNTRSFNKPKGLGTSASDYYVLILYKNHAYTINGIETGTLDKDTVIWLPELPDSADTIKVYAKDGAIRDGLNTFANIADTTVYKADGTTSAGATSYGSGQTYEVYKAQRGETIVVKTTIADTTCTGATDTYRDRYYVRGFCVNGEVPQILSPNNDGVYTLTYTVPEEYEGKYIEITPIYYLKDTTKYPVVTFRATDFPKNQHNWGNVPYCYPFYGSLSDKDNAFGAYPGQPLVFYKGQYSMQVPVKSTSPFSVDGKNTNVAGITMSNGYYDSIHKMIMGYGDDSASADHVQTYDYGDFWKIFNEKKPVDNIVFDFKYRTVKHNLIDDTTGDDIAASTLTGKYTNGFELLKNFHGRNVDLFGTPLSGDAADPSKTPAVYVVSIGGINDGSSGVENIAGFYATEWRVYAPNDMTSTSTTYKKMSAGNKSSIPPEVLVLNDDDDASFNTSTYPSAVYKTGKLYTINDWKALYQALENYRGLPVYISYEAADAQNGAEDYQTGTHGATRNDGRWLYSKNGESITSNIKIQYSNDNGETYIDLNTATPEVEGLSAYFTNTDVYGTQTYATTIDPDKTFNFEAKTTNGQYKFVGWYLDDSNKTLITNDNAGSTERSGSYTFIAKFMKVTSGQLILSHSTDTGTIGGTNYDGAGTVTIAAVVKDGNGATVKTFDPTTSDITLDNKIIKSDNTAYTVDVTLTATRGNNSALGTTILATPDDQESKFFDYGNFTVSADGKTRTYNFTFSVGDLYSGTTQDYMNLIYHSYFKNYVFNYTVNYEFTGRDGEKKIYNRAGTLTAPQAEAYVYKDTVTSGGSEIDMRFLRKEFFESLAPYESNFRQSLTWNFTNKQFTDGTNYVYNCNAHFEAIQNDSNEKVNVTFVLPYVHDNGVATLNNGVGTAATATNFELINDGTNDNRVEFGKIPKLLNNAENGIYTAQEKIHWIAAPTKLSNGKFFSHWSIKTTDSEVEVAKCYFPGFNFLAYENYVIEAIYDNAESDYGESGIYTNATYLSTTRNQWNALKDGDNIPPAAVPSVEITDRDNAADVLFNDFVLNYHYKDVNIYKNDSTSNDISELGVVVERVKELDKNSDDSYDTRISSYSSLAENKTNVTTVANDSAVKDGGSKKIDGLTYYKQRINKNQLDNKNRILFYEAFYNAAGWDSENQKPAGNYTAKRYVYRAYTYITYTDGNGATQTVLSDKPAYFIMYDVATAKYSSN